MVGREFDVTDSRDKIYCVLGLSNVPISRSLQLKSIKSQAEHDSRETMVVGYSRSVSEGYQYATRYLINRDKKLDVLSILPTHRNENSHDLPSWVQDWRVPITYSSVTECLDYFVTPFDASLSSRTEHQDQLDLGRLTVLGWLVDRIEGFLDVVPVQKDTRVNISEPARAEPYSVPMKSRLFNSKPTFRRCCQTAGGSFGVVPSTARVGEGIFIVLGSKMPLVLMRVDDGCTVTQLQLASQYGSKFEVIGPCCMDPYMGRAIVSEFGAREVPPNKIVLV